MPWIGIRNGEKVIPEAVEDGTGVSCPDCGGSMSPRGPSSDGRARHFMHTDAVGGSSTGRDGATCGGGESDLHRRYKNHAVSRLRTLYDEKYELAQPEVLLGEDCDLPSGAENRQADALLKFIEPSPKLGHGLIIEVQYKNDAKDIESVERDYLDLGYSVVWTDEEDFTEDRCLLDYQDLVDRTMTVWPNAVPDHLNGWMDWQYDGFDLADFQYLIARWSRDNEHDQHNSYQRATMAYHIEFQPPTIEARLPPDWCDEQAQYLWRAQEWPSLFDPPARQDEYYIENVLDSESNDDTLRPPQLSVKLPPEWWESFNQDVWRSYPWKRLFDTPQQDQVLIEDALEVLDDESWTLEAEFPYNEFMETGDRELARVRRHLYSAWERGFEEYRPEQLPSDPDPPENPYDDVQCRQCGTFWHYTNDNEVCSNCSESVDYEWNWATGRISDDVYQSLRPSGPNLKRIR